MRRGDTRQRIQQVALELFAERGYDKTSLREVAERLEITRPALYYHFATKQDILAGVIRDMTGSIDELTDWAAAQPDTADAHREVLHRLAELLSDRWRPLMSFSQTNQAAIRDLPVAEEMQGRMISLISILTRPGDDPTQRFERRLAVIGVILASLPITAVFGDDESADYTTIAMDVASRLIGPTT